MLFKIAAVLVLQNFSSCIKYFLITGFLFTDNSSMSILEVDAITTSAGVASESKEFSDLDADNTPVLQQSIEDIDAKEERAFVSIALIIF